MRPRFLAPSASAVGQLVELPAEEAHHLTRVLRLARGAAVAVFDGRGREFDATVERATRGAVTVRLTAPVEATPEPRIPLTLAQAVLKGAAMDAVVRDAVMLGAAALRPIVTARTQIGLAALGRRRRVDHWRRIAVASAKQSRRAVVPPVDTPVAFETLAAAPAPPGLRLLLVEPSCAHPAVEAVGELAAQAAPEAAVVCVGPEGGWSAEELEVANRHRWRFLRLGRRTLRADAVPVAALAVLAHIWGDF